MDENQRADEQIRKALEPKRKKRIYIKLILLVVILGLILMQVIQEKGLITPSADEQVLTPYTGKLN